MASIYRGKRPPRMPSNKPKALPGKRRPRNHGLRNFRMGCEGGPYDGQILRTRHPGTLMFRVGNDVGYYSPGGKWMPAQTNA